MKRLEHETNAGRKHGPRLAVLPMFWCLQAVFPHMHDRGGGRINGLSWAPELPV